MCAIAIGITGLAPKDFLGRHLSNSLKASSVADMRKLASYIKKYGDKKGRKMYRTLQQEAAHASVHAKRMKAKAK
jgi:hypothetical protein